MSQTALPRVTYSNIQADFSGVHDLLDTVIAKVRAELLGQTWPHRIGGEDLAAGASYEAFSPIDNRILLGRFHRADAAVVERAVAAARTAQKSWGAMPWQERLVAMRRFADQLEKEKFELAAACLIEVGKSRLEAMGEAEEAIDLVRYYGAQMEENNGFVRPLQRAFDNEETSDRLRPYGVFGVIAPFNFPLALSVGMLSSALIAGNTVVYKPASLRG